MDTVLWIIQSVLAFIFLHAGLCKTFYPTREMHYLGQHGVVGVSTPLVRIAGVAEIFGAYGLVIPLWLNIVPILTPIAAGCLAGVMVLATITNLTHKKYSQVAINLVLLGLCLLICIGRSIEPYY